MMMSPVQKLKRCCVTLIIALVLVNNFTLSLASTSNSEPQQSQVNGKDVPPAPKEDSWETTDSDDILGIGKTIFIVICVVGGLVILGILLAICFCCACLCFAGRRKSSNRQPTQVAVQSNYSGAYPQQHQQSQNYGGNGGANYNYSKNDHHYEDNVGAAPYGNNNYNQHSVQHNQQPGYVHQQQHQQQQHHNVQNVAYQKSASPPRDPYANSIDQAGAHQGDPNLIPNRFRPNVPPKPKGVGGSAVPGWTAVTQEVKKRTQLTMSQQNHYNEGYNNDAYDGDSQYNGGMPSPSPPSHPKYGGKSTTNDNFSMY